MCEAACGMGLLTLHLAKLFPKSTFTAYDMSIVTIERAKKQAEKYQLTNVTFAVHDIFKMPQQWNESFDYVFLVDSIHDLQSPREGIQCMHNILKKGGQLSLLDFQVHSDIKDNIGNPSASFMYSVSMLYCLSMSIHEGGSGAGTCYGMERLRKDIKSVGFEIGAEVLIPGSQFELHYVCNKM